MDWLRYTWQLMLLTRKRKNAINMETATWATLAEDAKMEHLLKIPLIFSEGAGRQ